MLGSKLVYASKSAPKVCNINAVMLWFVLFSLNMDCLSVSLPTLFRIAILVSLNRREWYSLHDMDSMTGCSYKCNNSHCLDISVPGFLREICTNISNLHSQPGYQDGMSQALKMIDRAVFGAIYSPPVSCMLFYICQTFNSKRRQLVSWFVMLVNGYDTVWYYFFIGNLIIVKLTFTPRITF